MSPHTGKRFTVRLTAVSLAALGFICVAQGNAYAASKKVYHDQGIDCTSSWTNWSTVYTRSSPGGDVKLKLTNNVSGGLKIRLVNTDNVAVADVRIFEDEGTKVIARSVVEGTRFKLSTGNVCDFDGTWGGTLTY